MSRIIWPVAATLIAVVLVVGAVLTARSLHPVARSAPEPRLTVTETAKPKTITRTRVITKKVSSTSTVTCWVWNGVPYPGPLSTQDSQLSACTVQIAQAAIAADGSYAVLTDPAGQSADYTLVRAGG
jgi:hypothetical protein